MERTNVKTLMEAKGVPYWAVYFGVTIEEINALPWYNAPMTDNEQPTELLSHQLITRAQESNVPETNKEEEGTPAPEQENTDGTGPESTKEDGHRPYRGRKKNRT